MRAVFGVLLLIGLMLSCEGKKTELLWNRSLFEIGSQSSPRAADLNGDGTLDIVFGAGTSELAATDRGVVALDGATGEVLWTQEATAQIVGSATFLDVSGDGTPEVIIGGRNGNLMALDGSSGEVVWRYAYAYADDPVLTYARFNFYNCALTPDQNGDGLPELLAVNGGNWDALPGRSEDRYPGVLMLFDPADGSILAADTMPDGKESYMSPLLFRQPGDATDYILFGSGGETISGNLYLATLDHLRDGSLGEARTLVEESGHGFIAPPVLADITGDGWYDILAISHASTVFAIDGRSREIVWQRAFPGMESSSSLAVGRFSDDDTPDLFALMSRGVWPMYNTAQQVMLDGKNGDILHQDTLGCFYLGSPVARDLDHDGRDEVLFSINDYDCHLAFSEDLRTPPTINNQLVFLNFASGRVQVVDRTEDFKNIFSTPWIGDLDKDGYLDIVYCQYYNLNDLLLYRGMRVKRISTSVRIYGEPGWDEYMGPEGKGVYPIL